MTDQRLPQSLPVGLAAIGLGFAEEVKEMQAADATGGCKAAVAATPDHLALRLAVTGTEQASRSEIDASPCGADQILVALPAPTRAECEPILEGIIPDRFRSAKETHGARMPEPEAGRRAES